MRRIPRSTPKTILARLYPKLRTWLPLSGKNPGFLANTFPILETINEVQKVKLPSHKDFSDSDHVAKKMDKVELRGCLKSRKVCRITPKSEKL